MIKPEFTVYDSAYKKPIVLTFVGNYLPGYKAGGILRSLANAVDNLRNDIHFWIVTRDRDLKDDKPYDTIRINQWQPVGHAMVYYMPTDSCTIKRVADIIQTTRHDKLYLNSFFDPFTVLALLARKLRRISSKYIIVSPRGEFAWPSLRQKYLKKIFFIQLAKLFRLYNNVTWHASSAQEEEEIIRVMKIRPESIHVALDLPDIRALDMAIDMTPRSTADSVDLRIIFLSRISREKNLDYALRILMKVNFKVIFDIYGPIDNATYWKECQKILKQLPENVKVNYRGGINHNKAIQLFSAYDLFFFPTGGENYGHVIAESLTAGTPVLISDKTPWKNLQSDGLGWDISLANENSFVTVIEHMAETMIDARLENRILIKSALKKRFLDTTAMEANRQLFRQN